MIRIYYLTILTALAFLTSAFASVSSSGCKGERLTYLENLNPSIKCAVVLDKELIFPRNIVTVGEDILLVDKGSNLFNYGKKAGAIYRYNLQNGTYTRETLLNHLDDPNDIDTYKDINGRSWVYFTTRNGINRFRLRPENPLNIDEPVLRDFPTQGWHKLLAIHISGSSLFVSVPSSSDHCESRTQVDIVEFPCSESARGAASIRMYKISGKVVSSEHVTVANGLRAALAVSSINQGKRLLVGDNGWDNIDLGNHDLDYKSTPNDELNLIELPQLKARRPLHFGWPYCFDKNKITPPYRAHINSCTGYEAPLVELAAHSAPLNIVNFQNHVLVNLHGPGTAGAKTIRLSLPKNGDAQLKPQTLIKWSYSSTATGRPFGLAVLNKSELLFTDDWNRLLIKIVLHQ